VTMLLASNKKVMGKFGIPVTLKVIGWIATVVMLMASIGLLATLKN
jgi:Mn2+/Fe2+ NRAMP family transporter